MDDGNSEGHDIGPDEGNSEGHDIGPDEDRPGDFAPVQVISGYHENSEGAMEIEYETTYVRNRPNGMFYEPLDETPSPRSASPQRNWLYHEKNRWETFRLKWSIDYPVTPADLARDGLYYVGPRDRVKCAFCQKTIHNWEPGDNVEREHRRLYPHCEFVKGKCGHLNVPLDPSQDLKKNFGLHMKTEEGMQTQSTLPPMQDYSSRLKSYPLDWCHISSVAPDALANAGFFYVGPGDAVKCFSCGLAMEKWDPGDDPWEEHEKYAENCPLSKQRRHNENMESESNSKTGTSYSQAHNNDVKTGHMLAESQREPVNPNQQPLQNTGASYQPVEHSHTQPSQPVQASTSQLEEDLNSAAVRAVREIIDVPMEELTRRVQRLRINKGPNYKLKTEDLMYDEDGVDGKGKL